MPHAYIYDAVRTPRSRGRKDGALATVRPVDLARQVLQAIERRNPGAQDCVVDTILGCVTAIGDQGGNIAKTAALAAGFAPTVGGLTVNRFCGSGLEAINQGVARIVGGGERAFVCGGVESMSGHPIGSDGGSWSNDPEIASQTHFVPQGISADLIATLKGYSRTDVDSLAVESQRRAAQAMKSGAFEKSLVPVIDINQQVLLERDELPRPETTLDVLGQLQPSFAQIGREVGFDDVAIQKYPSVERIHHVHHAGNSSGIADGAAAVLIADRDFGQSMSWTPRARILSYGVASTDPTIMLMGPGPASRAALDRAGMSVGDIDLFEVNEAFASVVLNYRDEMGIDPDQVNVNGGSYCPGTSPGSHWGHATGNSPRRIGATRSNYRSGSVVHRRRYGNCGHHRTGVIILRCEL